MQRELVDRLAEARRQLRRVILRRGFAWLAATIVGWIVLAGTIDYFFHVSGGMRVVFLSAAGIMAVVVAYRFLIEPLAAAVTDLELAQRVERLHPEFQEALSSTIAFQNVRSGDVWAGSPALRRAVIDSAAHEARNVDFTAVVDPKAGRTALITCGIVGVLAGLAVLLDPSSAAVALQRLADPFGSTQWPKRTRIEFVSLPDRVAKGDSFAVEIEVKGVVPDRIQMEFRFADGHRPAPTLLAPVLDTQGRFVGGLEAAMQPFEFRVEAGDADTDWTAVNVVPSPDVAELTVTATPPAYTRLPVVTYSVGRGHVDGVVGSHVRVVAVANKPIRSGSLLWQSGSSTPGEVDDASATLIAEFPVTSTDSYRILLEDSEGMSNESRSPKLYRVRAIEDTAPQVRLEKPQTDGEITTRAQVPIRALIHDDFGIDDVSLLYRVETTAQPVDANTWQSESLFAGDEAPKQQIVEYSWDLSPLRLAQGSLVVLKVVARDYRDAPAPNVGESREVRLRVVSDADFLRRVDGEQRLLREELDRLRKLQDAALAQTRDLSEKAGVKDQLDDDEREKLLATETMQRRVREKASQSDSSIQKQIRDLIEKLQSNRIDDLDTKKRLALMDSELDRIAAQHLSQIERNLTQARKRAQSGPAIPDGDSRERKSPGETPPSQPETRKPEAAAASTDDQPLDEPSAETPALQDKRESSPKADSPDTKKESEKPDANPLSRDLGLAREHQEQVIESLDAMLEQLEKWESVAEVVNEAREVERKQAEISKETTQLDAQTMGKSAEALSREEQAAIAAAAAKQDDLSQQLNRLEQKMSRQAQRAGQEDKAAADAMSEAQQKSKESNLTGKMAEAAKGIRENHLSEAGRQQSEVQKTLREIVASLEDRQEQELKRLVKDLAQAEEDLEGIREEQRRLQKETEDAQAIQDPEKRKDELARLQRRQAELQKKAEEFARRLSRLQARSASQSSGKAASRMADASRSLEQDQQNQAIDKQEEALEELQEAQDRLAEARQEAEEQLAREQLAKVADSLRDIHQRQLALKAHVERLEGIRQEGEWTRAQIQTLLGLARAEGGLAEEAAALKERLTQAKVFVMVLEQAVELMRHASAQLGERVADARAQRAMDRAAKKFARLLDSLGRDPSRGGGGNRQQEEGEGGAGQSGDGEDGIPSLAQIKLLKGLQEEILEETQELAQARNDNEWSAEERERFEDLSKRQGRLADLIRELTQPAEEESPLFQEDRQ